MPEPKRKPKRYCIIRRWSTKKRAYQVVVGSWSTKRQAEKHMQEVIDDNYYPPQQFSIAIYREVN